MAETLLKVEGLQAWYGESHVLHGVDFKVRTGGATKTITIS